MKKSCIIHNESTPEYFVEERCHITEWWNSPDDNGISIARARVEPEIATRLHRLRGVTERYVILEGRGRVEVGTITPEEVGPGDVVMIPADVPQRITNISTSDLIFLVICTPRFSPSAYEDIEDDIG